jgi:hypothetical protein
VNMELKDPELGRVNIAGNQRGQKQIMHKGNDRGWGLTLRERDIETCIFAKSFAGWG